MSLNKRDQSLLMVVGVILACATIWYFWLSPTAQSITSASQKIVTLQNNQTTLQQRITFIDATSKDLVNNPDGLKLMTLAAPSNSGINDLISSFDSMAAASGVNLTSIQPQSSTTQTTKLDLTVNVSGTYSAVQTFVGAIEKNERPIIIKTMSLSGAANTGGITLVSATLNLSVVQASVTSVSSVAGGTQ